MKMMMPVKPPAVVTEPTAAGGPDNDTDMAWFNAFRGDFGNTYYGEHRTSVTLDIPFVAVIYACILISIAILIAAAGIRGKERWYTLVRLLYSLAVGSVILVSIFGYCWLMGDVGVHTNYIYRNNGLIDGRLGIRVGLNRVNMTLTGSFMDANNLVDYNEELALEDAIGKNMLWKALERGLPQPLLSALEYFDVDEGGLRYGRSCRMGGYFANMLLWTAFSFWVMANVLLCSVVWYGASCFTLTGVCMVLAAVVYNTLCPQFDIKLPCADGLLELRYGWCFWSVLVVGCTTTLVGLVLFAIDYKAPKKIAEFFLLEPALDDLQDEYKQLHTPSGATSRPDTPDTSLKILNHEIKSSTPDTWYMSYNSYGSSQVNNPIFQDSGNDTCSHTGTDSFGPPRQRSYSSIAEAVHEEDEGEITPARTNSLDGDRTPSGTNDGSKTPEDRLKEVYLSIEPSLSMAGSGPILTERPDKLTDEQ